MNEYPTIEEALEHFGIKGMRWGIRKDRRSSSGSSGSKEKSYDMKAQRAWARTASDTRAYIKVYNRTADRMNNGLIEEINNRHKGKLKGDDTDPKDYDAYLKDYRSTFDKVANEELAKQLGGSTTSPSGEQSVKIKFDTDTGFFDIVPTGKWKESPLGKAQTYDEDGNKIEHSGATDFPMFKAELFFDEDGYITSLEIVETEIKQTGVYPTIEEALQHYGVKGMRWGIRKDRRSADAKSVASLRKKKASQLSNAELQAVAKRIRLEQDYERLNPSLASRGKSALGKILRDAATEVAKETLKTGLQKAVKDIPMDEIQAGVLKQGKETLQLAQSFAAEIKK